MGCSIKTQPSDPDQYNPTVTTLLIDVESVLYTNKKLAQYLMKTPSQYWTKACASYYSKVYSQYAAVFVVFGGSDYCKQRNKCDAENTLIHIVRRGRITSVAFPEYVGPLATVNRTRCFQYSGDADVCLARIAAVYTENQFSVVVLGKDNDHQLFQRPNIAAVHQAHLVSDQRLTVPLKAITVITVLVTCLVYRRDYNPDVSREDESNMVKALAYQLNLPRIAKTHLLAASSTTHISKWSLPFAHLVRWFTGFPQTPLDDPLALSPAPGRCDELDQILISIMALVDTRPSEASLRGWREQLFNALMFDQSHPNGVVPTRDRVFRDLDSFHAGECNLLTAATNFIGPLLAQSQTLRAATLERKIHTRNYRQRPRSYQHQPGAPTRSVSWYPLNENQRAHYKNVFGGPEFPNMDPDEYVAVKGARKRKRNPQQGLRPNAKKAAKSTKSNQAVKQRGRPGVGETSTKPLRSYTVCDRTKMKSEFYRNKSDNESVVTRCQPVGMISAQVATTITRYLSKGREYYIRFAVAYQGLTSTQREEILHETLGEPVKIEGTDQTRRRDAKTLLTRACRVTVPTIPNTGQLKQNVAKLFIQDLKETVNRRYVELVEMSCAYLMEPLKFADYDSRVQCEEAIKRWIQGETDIEPDGLESDRIRRVSRVQMGSGFKMNHIEVLYEWFKDEFPNATVHALCPTAGNAAPLALHMGSTMLEEACTYLGISSDAVEEPSEGASGSDTADNPSEGASGSDAADDPSEGASGSDADVASEGIVSAPASEANPVTLSSEVASEPGASEGLNVPATDAAQSGGITKKKDKTDLFLQYICCLFGPTLQGKVRKRLHGNRTTSFYDQSVQVIGSLLYMLQLRYAPKYTNKPRLQDLLTTADEKWQLREQQDAALTARREACAQRERQLVTAGWRSTCFELKRKVDQEIPRVVPVATTGVHSINLNGRRYNSIRPKKGMGLQGIYDFLSRCDDLETARQVLKSTPWIIIDPGRPMVMALVVFPNTLRREGNEIVVDTKTAMLHSSELRTANRPWTRWREESRKDQGLTLGEPGICETTRHTILERWKLQGRSRNRVFKREHEFLDRLIRCLSNPDEPFDDPIVFYGDGRFGACVKGQSPGFGGRVLSLLRKWFVVFSIDEFRSSKLCFRCTSELVQSKDWRIKTCTQCTTRHGDRALTVQRDISAACSMLRQLVDVLFTGDVHDNFKR